MKKVDYKNDKQLMNTNKSRILITLKAYLISFACTIRFDSPLEKGSHETLIDYLKAEIKLLLGEYQFNIILVFLLAFIFLKYTEKYCSDIRRWQDYVLPTFFSFWLFIGTSYAEQESWCYCFGSPVNACRFGVALVGMSILLQRILVLLMHEYKKVVNSTWRSDFSDWLFDRKCFCKVFLILVLVWMPIVIISYPGNLCNDAVGQIEQVLGNANYSSHHPLVHTLIMGGLVKIGYMLWGNYELGLFLYIIFQEVLLASACAGSIWWLSVQQFDRGKVSHIFLCTLLGLYICSPMYSNMVSTALKDVPFVAVFLWYMIMLAELLLRRERWEQPKFVILFISVQIVVCLLRNNGFYVIFLTGIMICCIWWKCSNIRQRFQIICYLFLIPVIVSKIVGFLLLSGLSAQEGKVAEMLSLPFQQTARYIQLYQQELTKEEEIAISCVLGEVDIIAIKYNPRIADPVKNLYYIQEEVTDEELANYLIVWGKGFFKHPCVYLDAFLNHVYGWFSPQISNAVRYEADYDLIPRKGLFPAAGTILLFAYQSTNRIFPLSFLQNVGVYTWAMLVLLAYAYKQNRKTCVLFVPLMISLLICMVAPCFYGHPRYAYPYMISVPFLYGLIESSRERK